MRNIHVEETDERLKIWLNGYLRFNINKSAYQMIGLDPKRILAYVLSSDWDVLEAFVEDWREKEAKL